MYRVGDHVRLLRGPFKHERGEIVEIRPYFAINLYLLKVPGQLPVLCGESEMSRPQR